MSIRPVDPLLPYPLGPLLTDIADAVRELETPTKPLLLASVAFASLPPAANWPGGIIHVADRNCIAVSTPVAGVYTWLRADGTAL